MANRKLVYGFLILMSVYALTRFFRTFTCTPPFFKYYFTDLLYIPTVCFLGLLGVRYLKRDNSLTLSIGLVSTLVVLTSVYFEWYLPNFEQYRHPYTADSIDILMYGIGGFFFLLYQKRFL